MINNDSSNFVDAIPMSKLEHANALHTTLPLEDLISLIASEIRDIVVYDSFEFENLHQSVHIFMGVPKLHKCHYVLKAGDIEFGELTLTRVDPFCEREIILIEGALGALATHLANALTFQTELGLDSLLRLQADGKRAPQA
jgi:hypothetical protein